MKKNTLSLALTVLFATSALASNPIDKIKKSVSTEKSTVTWKGYKVTGSHYGTIDLKAGHLVFDGDQLIGGDFSVDMTTLVSHDLQGEDKGKLEGHLKSDDFFGTETYPSANLVFTNVEATGKNSYKITGDLTVKGKTHPVTFDLSVYGSKATANVKIDRSRYDVRYGSGSFFDDLGDKTIYDEFDLVVDLVF
ncbi:YceI family protein [Flavobacteriaceae bacterium F89]|uniref:YceI family protein n=1 Tax=Cerina litoralis TaxID=2874477 RepID=A0AAE3EU31_9FLAO|nr:YceI family protein [Cerina litoralis]MCG2459637.1 YceI family protein [Cerina litoralis]